MSIEFLSEDWFKKVDQLTKEAGTLDVQPALKSLVLNLAVQKPNGQVEMAMAGGKFSKGFHPDASVTVSLPADLAKKVFIEFDSAAAMQGFMAGQMTIDGDMSQLMTLQSVQPTASQKALLDRILAMTA